MKNIIITILALATLVLGGYLVYDKFISEENNKIEKNKKSEENVVVEESNEVSDCADNGIKYYESSDSLNFLTLLPERNTKMKTAKGLNDVAVKDFILRVGHGYTSDYIYGSYVIENNVIKLYVLSGCDYSNNTFTCELPEGTNIVYTNGGEIEITLNYSQDKIMLGNVELNIK